MKRILLTALLLGGTLGAAHANTLYVGVDTVDLSVDSFSTSTDEDAQTPQTQRDELDSSILRIRAGWNVNENFGLELQYGLADDDTDLANNTIEISDYIGVFAVPTADIASFVKLEIPLGYAIIESDDADEKLESESYGVNFRFLPAKLVGSDFPLSLSAGFMVYGSENSSRISGANFGARFDF